MLAAWLACIFLWPSDEFLTPAESLAKIRLPPGYVAELVACEPNVESPVAISFDERGRMFVAEYRDYPNGPPKGEPPLSRIRLLEDKDGDGFFETATIFADRLNFAQGVLAINGGVIVTAAPDILFLKDTNGDNVADKKRVLFTGFKAGNPQLRVSHPRLAIDNMVYVSNGLSGGEVHHVAAKGPVVPLARDDFRFDPKTMIGEATTGFGQFGNTFDDWGRRFTCSNRNPIMHSFLPKRVLNRNDQIPIPVGYADVGPSGGDTRVYPIARTTTTAESHAGTHTAACGIHVYRGDLCPELHGNVFVCEPTGYLVTRSKLYPLGAGFQVERDRPNEDFLASADTWFRPVSLADGPDGALYVVDMHREVVEHPDYLPKGVGANYRFRAGANKGRILRIKPTNAKPRQFKTPTTTAELLALQNEENGWRRDLGQRLLIERNATDAFVELRRAARERKSVTRAHAIWTLRGLNALLVEDLLEATKPEEKVTPGDKRYYTDETTLLAGELLIPTDSRLQDRILDLASFSSFPRTRMTAAWLAGDFNHPMKADALGAAAARPHLGGFQTWVARAALSACAGEEGQVLESLRRHAVVQTGGSDCNATVSQLCAAATHRDENQLRIVMRFIATEAPSNWRIPALRGLVEGFRRPNPWKVKGLGAFMQSPPRSLENEVKAIAPLLAAAEEKAFDGSSDISAIALAGLNPESQSRLLKLLGADQPSEVQAAVLGALGDANPNSVVQQIVNKWNAMSPAVQQAAVDFCFRRRDAQVLFLKAIDAKSVPASAVGAERREMMLVFSSDKEIKALAQKLFGAAASNRAALIEQYLPSARKQGDVANGKAVFQRVCATCHRLKGFGVSVGPELADVRQKSKETLLTDILDPNRTVEPRFVSYVAELKDGRTVAGLLTSESSAVVVLKIPNGAEETIRRDQIERLRSTGRSLMPEGVEKDVTPAQMADLLEFICSPN